MNEYFEKLIKDFKGIDDAKAKALASLRPDSQKRLHFSDRARIQQADYVPEEEGVYITADSGIIINSRVEMPDVTGDMLVWFGVWHQLDPIRYKVWDPQDHYDVQLSDKDRARLTDKTIPMKERIWGTVSNVVESMNCEEPDHIGIRFTDPSLLGYDTSIMGKVDYCMHLVCTNDMNNMGGHKIPIHMAQVLKKNERGITEWNSHWWIGCGIVDGKELIIPMPEMVAEFASQLLVHNHKEMEYANVIIPELYKKFATEDM